MSILLISFFLNQQFITQSVKADHSSYFITTYNRSRLTWNKRKLEQRKREKEKRLIVKPKRKEERRKGKIGEEDKTSYKVYL